MIPGFRDHAANERTFLAWVRTAIAIVGFGLAVGRLKGTPGLWSAGIMTGGGALIVILAYLRMRNVSRKIDASDDKSKDGVFANALLIGMVATLCVTLVAFAFQVNGSP